MCLYFLESVSEINKKGMCVSHLLFRGLLRFVLAARAGSTTEQVVSPVLGQDTLQLLVFQGLLQEGEEAGGRDDGDFRGEAVGDLLAFAFLVDAIRVQLVRVMDVAIEEGFEAEVAVWFLGLQDLERLGGSEHFAG